MLRYHFEAVDPTGAHRRLHAAGHTTDPAAAEPFRAAEQAALHCPVRIVADTTTPIDPMALPITHGSGE